VLIFLRIRGLLTSGTVIAIPGILVDKDKKKGTTA